MLAGLGIPDPHRRVVASAGEQLLTVYSDGAYGTDPILIARQGGAMLPGLGIPDPHRTIRASAGEQLAAVDGDRAHRPDPSQMACQGGAMLPGLGIPDPHRTIVTGAGEQLAAVDGDRAHRPDPSQMACQGGAMLPGLGIPDPHRTIVTGAGEQLAAVDGDRAHRPDPPQMACQNGAFTARCHQSPLSSVRRFPAADSITGTQTIHRFSDAEQCGAVSWPCIDRLWGQLEKPGTATSLHGTSIVGDLHYSPKISVQQVCIIAKEIID